MPSNAFAGVGTVFKRVGVAIAEVNSITLPSQSRETIDVTSLDSTGGYREFITSFRDNGEVSIGANFTLAGYEDMLTDFESDTAVVYSIELPDTGTTTITFSAFVTGISGSVTTDDKVTMDVTMKVTGVVGVS